MGLYRGVGKYTGKPVLVGAVIDDDGTLASTTQYVGKIRFVTPIGETHRRHSVTSISPSSSVPTRPRTLAALVTALH